jgi:two-component system NtrC family sensor kinase
LSLEKANSDLKRAQQEIIRTEKMAGVGRLAAGIAHEIGNPIGIVLGYLDLLKQPDLNDTDRVDFLQRAEKETQRINSIIRQLLDLARPKETASRPVSMHAIIGEITEVMRLQPSMRDIKIETQLDAGRDVVWANGEQLRQVLLNLFLNGADAIIDRGKPYKGRIQISTFAEAAPDEPEGEKIMIMVKDNGTGIDPEQIGNIFDPFYTTKEPGKGTGLGLAVSYMIIDKIGGAIHVESELNKGTTVLIMLPVNKVDPGV